MKVHRDRVGLSSNVSGVLTRRGNVDRDIHTGRPPWEDEGRD